MENNLTSADPLSYTTNGSGVDPVSLISVSCVYNPTPSCGAPNQKHWTERQVSNSTSKYGGEDVSYALAASTESKKEMLLSLSDNVFKESAASKKELA